MKKFALFIVMVFAFSLSRAGNHVVVKTAEHNNTLLQMTTAMQGTNLQAAPVFDTGWHCCHAIKSKRPDAGKKTKKTKEHKEHRAKKEGQHKNREANKTKHEHHHHHKKTDNN